jgi:hypothetical protein
MFFQSEFQADDPKIDCTPGQISLAETLEITELRKEPRVMLTLSDISAISSLPQAGEWGRKSPLQAFMLGHQDVQVFSQASLSLSTTYVIANFEPAKMKQEVGDLGPKNKIGMVCEQHSYVEKSSTFGSNNDVIAQETQMTTSSLGDPAMDGAKDDSATEPCQPAIPKYVPEQAAGRGPDLGSPTFPTLRGQLVGWEADKHGVNMATDQPREAQAEPNAPEDTNQPVETLTCSLNRRDAVRPSEPPVSRANSGQIEQLRPCLSLADSRKADLVQKPPATPSDDEKVEQSHKLPVSLADDEELDQAHTPSVTDADDGKTHRTSEALQALSQEDAKVVTSSTPLVSLSTEKQRAESTDASKMALNASLLERVNTSDPISTEVAPEAVPPKRPAPLGSKTIIRGGSVDEPIVIDASDDEQEEEDLGDLGHRKRLSASRRVRSRAQQADGVVLWTDPKIEEEFLSKTRAIWYHIQSQWMEVRKLPGLEGMLKVVQYNNFINAIASNSVENGMLAHDDVIMLRDRYKRVANQALSKLSSRSDRNLVRNLRRSMNRFHDESQMVKLITDHPMRDDEEDVDYRPVKRRRS